MSTRKRKTKKHLSYAPASKLMLDKRVSQSISFQKEKTTHKLLASFVVILIIPFFKEK
jgi:hypothetical protein